MRGPNKTSFCIKSRKTWTNKNLESLAFFLFSLVLIFIAKQSYSICLFNFFTVNPLFFRSLLQFFLKINSTVRDLITIQHEMIILGVTEAYYLSFLNF